MQTGHWQLFLDDHVVARNTGFERVVHQPKAMGVVIPADKPWETAGAAGQVFRREDGSFFSFYNAMWWDIDKAASLPGGFKADRAHHIFTRLGYATSEDGIHWQKPNFGLVDAPTGADWLKHAPYPSPVGSSRANNLGVPFVVIADLGQHGNVRDPAKRYALRLAPEQDGEAAGIGSNWQYAPRGYFASEIPDFLNDPNWRDKLVDSGSNFEPRRNMLHFWDDIHEEWAAMEQGVIGHWLPTREVARFASKDLLHWTSEVALYPDAADPHDPDYYDEPMSLTPFCAEGVVFGLLSWFHSDRAHPDGGPNLVATPEHPNIWPWCRKGTNEMRITISHDGGKTWDRTSSREAWIPHGPEEDSYDRLVIGPTPPVYVGDEDWFYINVVDGDHLITRNNPEQGPYVKDRVNKHNVALYIQKHNRYVSLTTRNQKEVLISKPVEVTGDTLQLNVDASRGQVRVGIASADPVLTFGGTTPSTAPHLLEDNLLPGFAFGDGLPVLDNSIEYSVAFKDGMNLASLRGKSVCLLFEVVNADLYGFRFV